MKDAVFLKIGQFAERSGLPVSFIETMIKDGRLRAETIGRTKVLAASQLADLEERIKAPRPVLKGAPDGV